MTVEHLLSIVATAVVVFLSIVSAVHALLNKRDPRAALGWIVTCIALPVFGPLIYALLGVNRSNAVDRNSAVKKGPGNHRSNTEALNHPLDHVTAKVSRYPCTRDNRMEVLQNGEQAYPAMIKAIEQSKHSVLLCTYIFDSDEAGQAFVTALADCVARGVQVRVLIDSVGSLYSFPSAIRLLRRARVPTSRFLPLLHRDGWKFNMRNHRKILAIDGCIAFTGGMNIGSRHMVGRHRADSAQDMQFLVEGQAVQSLTDIFCRDWEFATGEALTIHHPERLAAGHTSCRPVSDGPGFELGTLPKLLLGLISTAQECVTIVTPYFLPPPAIAGALIGAALRGVRVRILIPERSNLPYLMWATEHALEPLLRSSVEVYCQPGPFSHTKMLLIDDDFLQVGSYNMDDRSLRLNFELALNIYDAEFRRHIDTGLQERLLRSKRIEHASLSSKRLSVRIRNAVSWLFTPYL